MFSKPYKKRAKKEEREFFSSFTLPPTDYAALFERDTYLFSLLFSLSLSVLIVRFETLSVYIRVSVSISHSHRVLKKRDLHIIYIIYIRVGREIWIGSTGKKRVSERFGKREKIEEEV